MMKTKRRMIQSVVAGLLMSAALVLAAGPVTPTAEAGPRPELSEGGKTKKKAPRQKREVKPNKRTSDRSEAKRSNEVRKPAQPKNDARRPAEVRKPAQPNNDARRPAEVRKPAVSRRDGKLDRRGDRRGDLGDRRDDDHRGRGGPDSWHQRVERRHDHWHYTPRHWFPRYVRAVLHGAPRHTWYAGARRIYIHDEPFYFHVGLGFYLGGLAIQFDLGNEPPWGYVYYDPYCDEVFWTLAEFRHHMRWYDHPPLLTLISAEYCGY